MVYLQGMHFEKSETGRWKTFYIDVHHVQRAKGVRDQARDL